MGLVLRNTGKITLHKKSEDIFVHQWTSEQEFSIEDKKAELQGLLKEKAQIISEPEPTDKELIEWAMEGLGRHPYYEIREDLTDLDKKITELQNLIVQCEAL